jgi:hypothetical protein
MAIVGYIGPRRIPIMETAMAPIINDGMSHGPLYAACIKPILYLESF